MRLRSLSVVAVAGAAALLVPVAPALAAPQGHPHPQHANGASASEAHGGHGHGSAHLRGPQQGASHLIAAQDRVLARRGSAFAADAGLASRADDASSVVDAARAQLATDAQLVAAATSRDQIRAAARDAILTVQLASGKLAVLAQVAGVEAQSADQMGTVTALTAALAALGVDVTDQTAALATETADIASATTTADAVAQAVLAVAPDGTSAFRPQLEAAVAQLPPALAALQDAATQLAEVQAFVAAQPAPTTTTDPLTTPTLG